MNNNGMKQAKIAVIIIGSVALLIILVFWAMATYGLP